MGRRGSCPSRWEERRRRRETWPSRRAAGRRGKPSSCRRKDARPLWTTILQAHRRLDNAPLPHFTPLPSCFLSFLLWYCVNYPVSFWKQADTECTVTIERLKHFYTRQRQEEEKLHRQEMEFSQEFIHSLYKSYEELPRLVNSPFYTACSRRDCCASPACTTVMKV